MIRLSTPLSALATLMLSATLAVPVFAQKATPPYKLSVFATAPKGSSGPDSIAVVDGDVFVGYGDGHDPAGADGFNSEVVEYRMDGTIERTYSVPGHSDGLKVDPATHLVWALQNEEDLTTGIITSVVTGLGNPGGMVFVNTCKFDQDDSHREDRDSCHDRDWDSH